jgi:hypothetical protein
MCWLDVGFWLKGAQNAHKLSPQIFSVYFGWFTLCWYIEVSLPLSFSLAYSHFKWQFQVLTK